MIRLLKSIFLFPVSQLFLAWRTYNWATTRIGVICQFVKNAHSISDVLSAGYVNRKICATVSMTYRQVLPQMPQKILWQQGF